MHGQTCIVTGASAGIGQALAQGLAARGAHVVLVCRNRERAEATQRATRTATGNAAIDIALADLSSQAEVRRLAEELCQRYPRMYALINNAGVVNTKRTVTIDGIETVFAVNHLAYFLLTQRHFSLSSGRQRHPTVVAVLLRTVWHAGYWIHRWRLGVSQDPRQSRPPRPQSLSGGGFLSC